jgi:hypothetical protein
VGVSARFALPFLAAGQASKEVAHNEAVQLLDLIVAAAVQEGPRTSAPDAPELGATYIVAAGATGAWAGHDQCLAGYTAGGWRFIAPRDGMLAYVVSTSVWAVFRAGAWEVGSIRGDSVVVGGEQVVGPRAAAIAAPTGGSTVDSQARAAVAGILSALRAHGLIAT